MKRGGEAVELTNVEYEILILLLTAAGCVVKREELGRELSLFDRSIGTHISHPRKKLGHHACESERVRPVRGVGYAYARRANAVKAESL